MHKVIIAAVRASLQRRRSRVQSLPNNKRRFSKTWQWQNTAALNRNAIYSSAEDCWASRAIITGSSRPNCTCHGSAVDVVRLFIRSSTLACDDDRRPISTPSNTVLSREAAATATAAAAVCSVDGCEQTLDASLIDRQPPSPSHSAARRRCLRQRRQPSRTTLNRATVTITIQASRAKKETVSWLAVSETLSMFFCSPDAFTTTSSDDDTPLACWPPEHKCHTQVNVNTIV